MNGTTITVGWTKSDWTTGYTSFMDGYRPGAAQHVIVLAVDLPPELEPQQIAELVFEATNASDLTPGGPAEAIRDAIQATGYRGEGAHYSLSVGDTVKVGDGPLYACQSRGWAVVEAAQ